MNTPMNKQDATKAIIEALGLSLNPEQVVRIKIDIDANEGNPFPLIECELVAIKAKDLNV